MKPINEAPKLIGIPIANDKTRESNLLKENNLKAVKLIPRRLTPGIKAKLTNIPIKKESKKDKLDKLLSLFLNKSKATIKTAAIKFKIKLLYKSQDLFANKKPAIIVGIIKKKNLKNSVKKPENKFLNLFKINLLIIKNKAKADPKCINASLPPFKFKKDKCKEELIGNASKIP
jgi:hypothetical protein